MAYSDVEWSNGDVLTEAKLDTMQGNSDHLRDEVNFKHIGGGTDIRLVPYQYTYTSIIVKIDSITIGTGLTIENYDISGYSIGSHTLSVEMLFEKGSFDKTVSVEVPFYKTSDVGYISLWADYTVSDSGASGVLATVIKNAILHRETVTW